MISLLFGLSEEEGGRTEEEVFEVKRSFLIELSLVSIEESRGEQGSEES